MYNPRRLAMPLSAALIAVLALSACSSSVNSVAPSSSAASSSSGSASASETASPSTSASSSTSASASASSSATSKALTDDNKAGKPRPTSTYGDPYPGATVHEDGSWEYKSESYTMTTKADGTWESFDAQRNERVHVNPDGSWIRVRESGDTDLTKGARGMEVKADGTWRSVDSYSTLYGTADGKVYQEKPGQEKREVGKELTPTTVPVTPIAYAEGGVGGNSVVPLKPRTPLKAGEKAQ